MLVDNGDGTFSIKMPPPWRNPQPLSDEAIYQMAIKTGIGYDIDRSVLVEFVKAIEKAHGIK